MRRQTLSRTIIGTTIIFIVLVLIVFGFMNIEHFLDNFKSH